MYCTEALQKKARAAVRCERVLGQGVRLLGTSCFFTGLAVPAPPRYTESRKVRKITMTKLVKLSSKGQLTLPKEIREELGLRPGDLLELEKLDQNRYVIAKYTPLRQLARALEEEARRRGYTEKDLMNAVEHVRQQLWQELVAQARKPRWPKKK